MKAGWALGGALVLSLWGASARAQSQPEIRVQPDATVVGVGDVVRLEMTATSADQTPSDPHLGPAPGFAVSGPAASSSQTHINMNGSRTDRYTLTAEWVLKAQRVGTFAIGPSTVVVGSARYSSPAVSLRVVPAGKAPPRRAPPPPQSPFGFSPFDPWRGMFPDFPGPDLQPRAPTVTTDPKLSLEAPRGQYLFLHASVDKTAAVVGEQVLFTVYAYLDVDAPRLDEDDPHEAQADDFAKRSLSRDDQEAPLAGYASIAGHVWRVQALRRWALFPLRSGDLVIGPMSVTVTTGRGGGSKRATETLHVHVSEPPLAGRPAGYALGDVGHFTLTAEVQPRQVEQGAAVGVHVELSGTGNMPGALAMPARADVEWLPPEVRDKLGPIGQDAYGGTRSFDWVARIKRAGSVDLGEVSLPFWNSEQKHYEVARASLGQVSVSPSAGAASGPAEAPTELLSGLPAPRDGLEGRASVSRHPDDAPLFWWAAVLGGPLAFGLAVAGASAGRHAARTLRDRRISPVVELRARVAAARVACQADDARGADAAVARALEAATLAHAGVSVRGAVGGEVAVRLERAGVAPDAAARVAEILRECETARFSPDAVDVAAARDRWLRAQGAIRQLEKRA